MKKAGYEFVNHTADIAVRAWGEEFPQALEQAALAMFEVLGGKGAKTDKEFEIEESASNKKELAVYFLSSVLSESEIRGILPSKIKIIEFSQKPLKIKAVVMGERAQREDDIKAVTHHGAKVEEREGECIIEILFDV
ncbi:hypothetical protein COU37_00075 [Candidatus Micrarchaeota archaeon CG10_big_fil_rev_8_21_14_0_10_45_29]|nr:MAG: hypothetical protein COU37_00075 [Candidatus Micrarchaeota archaeon CG10_big_fil_rev_8_21_14_0_10_45_29]